MIKVPHAELGYKRNIMMCTEGQGKNLKRKEMITMNNLVILKLRGGL
jgi:hypothetical protein